MTTYAVLGQLSAGPRSGYEIKSLLEDGAAHFWHASYSQIYSELRRLSELGLASEEHVRQDARPDKRVYTITPDGRDALDSWLREPWGLASLKDESLVKLTLADPLPPALVADELRRLQGGARAAAGRVRGPDRRAARRRGPLSGAGPAQGGPRPAGLRRMVPGGHRRADRLRGRPRHASRCRQVVWAAATGKFGPPKKAGKG